MSQTAVLIYGAGDFGHLLKSQMHEYGLDFAGFIDDTSQDPRTALTLEQAALDPKSLQIPLVCAIGYNNLKARKIAYSRALGLGFRLCTLIHPEAYVPNRLHVGVGSIVMARATIDATAQIHTAVVVWPGVVVSHDCVVEENTFLSPGAVLCGYCKIGHSTFVGANCTITDNSCVEALSFCKAGAVISSNKQ